jgi:hypothetical protein
MSKKGKENAKKANRNFAKVLKVFSNYDIITISVFYSG